MRRTTNFPDSIELIVADHSRYLAPINDQQPSEASNDIVDPFVEWPRWKIFSSAGGWLMSRFADREYPANCHAGAEDEPLNRVAEMWPVACRG